MTINEAPTKRDLRPVPEEGTGQEFSSDEAKTKPALAPVRGPATERAEFDFRRDPRHDPE
jgi:hypothetical protein